MSIGFRPFFLLTGVHGALVVPLSLADYLGYGDDFTWWPAGLWHMHEMVYGYAIAVIAGFLLTTNGMLHFDIAALLVCALARLTAAVAPDTTVVALVVATMAWSVALTAFVVVYAPILVTPRPDDRLG
ncbi:MAG: NnrS family protein [Pseudomonadota bacterium]|nr:NnrS family protein [Pseudomonadota bacterium]